MHSQIEATTTVATPGLFSTITRKDESQNGINMVHPLNQERDHRICIIVTLGASVDDENSNIHHVFPMVHGS